MIDKIPLKECLEGSGRQQKIPRTVLIVVGNSGRTLQPTIGIIRQSGLESSIGRAVVSCKYPR